MLASSPLLVTRCDFAANVGQFSELAMRRNRRQMSAGSPNRLRDATSEKSPTELATRCDAGEVADSTLGITMSRLSIALTLLVSLCPASLSVMASEPMQAETDEDGIWLKQGDQPLLYYQRTTKSIDGKWPRAGYVHPVFDLDGNAITEDFPEDHRHHRGIFWAWHQVWVGDKKIGDPWVCRDFHWDVTSVQTLTSESSAVMIADVQWKSPTFSDASQQMIPIVHERTVITAHRQQEAYRMIDFEISLRALVEGVKIGGSEDVKGYGGFSPRIQLSEQTSFLSSAGEVQPAKTAVSAGPWMNITQPDRGLVVMGHPENPPPHGQWILRQQRSMQNAVYPGRDPLPVSTTRPTKLRYRLLIHRGDLTAKEIEKLQP